MMMMIFYWMMIAFWLVGWLVGWFYGMSTLIGIFNPKGSLFACSYMVSDINHLQECYELFWTSPGSNTPWNNSCTASYPPHISKTMQVRQTKHCWRNKDELVSDVLLWTPDMDMPVLANLQELIYISFMWTQDVVWRTCWEWWMIGVDGESQGNLCCQRNLMMKVYYIHNSNNSSQH